MRRAGGRRIWLAWVVAWMVAWATLVALPGLAQDLVGERVKLTGRFEEGRVAIERVRYRDPRRDPEQGRITAAIDAVDRARGTLVLGPLTLRVTPATRFVGLTPDALTPGRRIEVRGRLAAPRVLVAERIEPGEGAPDEVELLGTVRGTEPLADGRLRLDVLGVEADLPASMVLRGISLARDLDDKRPESQLTIDLLGRPLVIGGEVGSRLRFEGDPELDSSAEDDRLRGEVESQLELFWALSPAASVFLEAKAFHERDLFRESGTRDSEEAFERGETWVLLEAPGESRLALQVGRQGFREEREWWWDEDLDAVRLHWSRFPFGVELGVAREVARVSTLEDRIDPEQEDVLRLLGRARWRWHPDHELALFALRQRDTSGAPALGARAGHAEDDPSDARLLWWGVRAMGDTSPTEGLEIDYWLDVARMSGRERRIETDDASGETLVTAVRRQRLRGFSFDAGITFALDAPPEPALTLAYALGSGDPRGDRERDASFRQTGLQDDNGRFRGVDRFRYYGELADPELSNLGVLTVSLGFPLLDSSSIEILYHHYRQDEAAPFARLGGIDRDPTGRARSLGQEWDVVVGLEEWTHLEVEVVGSIFRAGPAFGSASGETAIGGFVKLDWNF